MAAVVLLLYPSFGPSMGKNDKNKEADPDCLIVQILGVEGINIYKKTITKGNTKEERELFFSQRIVIELFNNEAVRGRMTEDLCFGEKGPFK